ncbi:MAG: hypothetical protein ACF8MJ_08385, partial [Phycisphaerales bacterium JB050]
MSDAPPLTLQRFPLASPPGESLELWLPSDPDDRVRRAQNDSTPAADLLGFWATLWPAARTTAHLVGTTNLIDPS